MPETRRPRPARPVPGNGQPGSRPGPRLALAEYANLKLGRRPPTLGPRLHLADYLTGIVPTIPTPTPPSADHFSKVGTWILGRNNEFGTCGPTSVANDVLLGTTYQSAKPVRCTDDDVFDLYRRSGNPTFDPITGAGDNGVDMQTMLSAVRQGGIAGIKCLAYASVDVTNLDELRAAQAIFGCLLYGVNLEVAQQLQTYQQLWDYSESAAWGGHAVLGGRYTQNPDRSGLISWQERIDMTDAFIVHQLEECWVVIWSWTVGTQQYIEGIDQATLGQDFTGLTHQAWPVTPTPSPDPQPGCFGLNRY